jgi:hypothetical protein
VCFKESNFSADISNPFSSASVKDVVGNLAFGALTDPFGQSSTPAMTPQELLAYNAAQPFLQEYQSGKLNPADKALVRQADTNATEAALQSFANAGISDSTARVQTVGTVKHVGSGVQAGSGSGIDVAKASNTQQILQTDLQNALAYLGVASGDAQALTGVNLTQNANITASLGAASEAFGKIYGGAGTTSGITSEGGSSGMSQFAKYIEQVADNGLSTQGGP